MRFTEASQSLSLQLMNPAPVFRIVHQPPVKIFAESGQCPAPDHVLLQPERITEIPVLPFTGTTDIHIVCLLTDIHYSCMFSVICHTHLIFSYDSVMKVTL